MDNLNKQIEIDYNNKEINVVESKRQLYKNFVCYNDLYKKFLKSNNANLHEYGIYEYNIKPYESVLKDLEQKYKIAKNKTRNARGNRPMNRIHHVPNMTNSAMARYEKEMNKKEMNKKGLNYLKEQSPRRTRKTQIGSVNETRNPRNPLINGFYIKVRT